MRDAPTRTRACVIPITTLATVFAVASCTLHRAPVYTDASPSKLERACQAVDEATGLEMTRTDRTWCMDMMQAWYSETWHRRPDPADQFTGVNQLRYLQAKAMDCRRPAEPGLHVGADQHVDQCVDRHPRCFGSSTIGSRIRPFSVRYCHSLWLLLRSPIRYAFIRRFLLKKICLTRFCGVGRVNHKRTFS